MIIISVTESNKCANCGCESDFSLHIGDLSFDLCKTCGDSAGEMLNDECNPEE